MTTNHDEGWDVFWTTGTMDLGDCRIERVDELEIFDCDQDAWSFVLQKACFDQSERHLQALRTIRDNNQTEYELIRQHFYDRTLLNLEKFL